MLLKKGNRLCGGERSAELRWGRSVEVSQAKGGGQLKNALAEDCQWLDAIEPQAVLEMVRIIFPQLTWFFILKGAIQLMVQPQVMMSWNGGYWPLFGLDAQPEQDLGGKRPVQASRAIVFFFYVCIF